MSYILDALKKIEHERNKKNRPDGRVNISGDLFQERSRPPARVGIWRIVLLVAVVALVTGGTIWFLLPGSGRKSAAVVRPSAPPAVPVNPPVVNPVVPTPLPVQTPAPPAAATPVPSSAPVPAAPTGTETAGGEEASPRDARRAKKQNRAQSSSPDPKQSAPIVPPPADIKLSGIAWQDERAARRVVINGFLLKEGAVVSGAKIIEIQADRVRFSTGTGQFELKLDAVVPSEVKR